MMQARSAKKSELAFCELAAVRAHLGLSSGGGAALLTLAELMGGDYHMGGAARVGPVAAWRVLKLLLKDKQVSLPNQPAVYGRSHMLVQRCSSHVL